MVQSCRNWVRFSLLLALLLGLSSVSSWAEWCIEDQEKEELDQWVTYTEEQLVRQTTQLSSLRASLAESQQLATTLKSQAKQASFTQTQLQTQIKTALREFEESKIYWRRRNAVTILIAILSGLVAGGVDGLLIETCQDPLQVKAAVNGARKARQAVASDVPILVQVTMETTGTMLVGG
ncbi:hypothetical protein LCGC14_0726080 [marine sediment metagenome]|uniref:Hcy-binding domain-containing protein n=1 Tax=marine sediment metagenome TaxID=412755 RepID=A0A0F9TI82_9ZZZZ